MTPGSMIEQMLNILADQQRRMKGLRRIGVVAMIGCAGAICVTAYGTFKGPLWSRAVNLALVYVNVWNLQSSIRRLKFARRALREMQHFRDVLELERLAQL